MKKGRELEELRYTGTIRGGRGMGDSGNKVRNPQDTSEGTADVVLDIRHGQILIQTYSKYPSQLDCSK